jgi:phage terminase small subunit
MKKPILTPKQERFIQEYLVDLNGTQAAIRAGYSKRTARDTASEYLAKPHIKAAVNQLKEKRAKETGVTAEWVITSIKEVAERCMQKVPVMTFDKEEKEYVQVKDEEGRDVWEFDSSGANRALELLGKHLVLFTDNVRHGLSKSLEDLLDEANRRGE